MESLIVSRAESCEATPSCPNKKKYSKVNEALKSRFLEYIVQDNMSIKEASLALNINYSSAKAILSNHRKSIINSNKKSGKSCKRAEFRCLTGFESFLNPVGEFVCTTGGKEVRRFDSYIKHKAIQKAPIILLAARKDLEYLENTSNSQ